MQTAKSNERRGLNAIVGLVVAGATLMAGLVALPVSKASAYEADDNFHSTLDPAIVPELTVTKYLSTKPGAPATGSSKDRDTALVGNTPAADVIFNVTQVKPISGKTEADIDPTDPSTFKKTGTVFAGQTDPSGVINKWYAADNNGKPTASEQQFPTGINYFVMEERQDISPSFLPGGLYHDKGYAPAQNSFFSLPYRTQTGDKGYLYHLHLFPKNVNDSDLTKQVTNHVDSTGAQSVLATPGDVISYRLTQRIYNEGAAAVKDDNKLDVSELDATPPNTNLIVSDRMTSALAMKQSTINVRLEGGNGTTPLVQGTDYSLTSEDKSPVGYDHVNLFPTETGDGTLYWTFKFFPDPTTVKNYAAGTSAKQFDIVITFDATVTANGDSTASSQGTIKNIVRSNSTDKGSGDNPEGSTDTPAATASFGKVDKEGKGLKGAVFRLVDPTDEGKYLASDGNTYAKASQLPPGATFYQATSNNQGAVVFSALPILDPVTKLGRAGDWRIEEVTAPDDFARPMVLFSKVSFAAGTGATDYVIGKTAEQIVKHFTNTPIEATHEYLSFARYNFTGTPNPAITIGGHAVDRYLANYKNGDGPVNLPLTGGRGIVLLLVIGLMVMGGALYARNRRNASRA